jgi:hypothetical protein
MVVTTGDKRKLLVAACDKHPGCELLVGVLVATGRLWGCLRQADKRVCGMLHGFFVLGALQLLRL